MTDEEFISAFEGCRFRAEEWTHEAHIRTACLYSKERSFNEALSKIRDGIKRLNGVIGVRKRGYHETITVFYLALIFPRVREMARWSWSDFKETNPSLFDPALLGDYYSEDVLNSRLAAGAFVKPDKKMIPETSTLQIAYSNS